MLALVECCLRRLKPWPSGVVPQPFAKKIGAGCKKAGWRNVYARMNSEGHLQGPDTRLTLLARARNPEDHEAWQEFYLRYRHFIESVALWNGASSSADDVVQTVFCELMRLLRTYEHSGKEKEFRSRLRRLTVWRSRDVLRKEKRGLFESLDGPPGAGGVSPADKWPAPEATAEQAHDEFRRVLLDRAMELARRRFSVRAFQVLEMKRDGHSSLEIGRQLGMTRGAVDKAFSDAKRRLADIVEEIQAKLP